MQALGDAFGNIFLVTAVLCVLGAILALGLPSRPATAEAPAPPERPSAATQPQTTVPTVNDRSDDVRPRESVGQRTG